MLEVKRKTFNIYSPNSSNSQQGALFRYISYKFYSYRGSRLCLNETVKNAADIKKQLDECFPNSGKPFASGLQNAVQNMWTPKTAKDDLHTQLTFKRMNNTHFLIIGFWRHLPLQSFSKQFLFLSVLLLLKREFPVWWNKVDGNPLTTFLILNKWHLCYKAFLV